VTIVSRSFSLLSQQISRLNRLLFQWLASIAWHKLCLTWG